jgi:hypothetical protein
MNKASRCSHLGSTRIGSSPGSEVSAEHGIKFKIGQTPAALDTACQQTREPKINASSGVPVACANADHWRSFATSGMNQWSSDGG